MSCPAQQLPARPVAILRGRDDGRLYGYRRFVRGGLVDDRRRGLDDRGRGLDDHRSGRLNGRRNVIRYGAREDICRVADRGRGEAAVRAEVVRAAVVVADLASVESQQHRERRDAVREVREAALRVLVLTHCVGVEVAQRGGEQAAMRHAQLPVAVAVLLGAERKHATHRVDCLRWDQVEAGLAAVKLQSFGICQSLGSFAWKLYVSAVKMRATLT